MLIRRKSVLTGTIHELEVRVDSEAFARWRLGTPISKAMPKLTSVERDFILTGVTREELRAVIAEAA